MFKKIFSSKEEKVVLTRKQYDAMTQELELLRYQRRLASQYVLDNNVLDRNILGTILLIPQNLLVRKNG